MQGAAPLAGGIYATCQSAAMAGYGVAAVASVVQGTGVVLAGGAAVLAGGNAILAGGAAVVAAVTG
jgi:hypothetical protein